MSNIWNLSHTLRQGFIKIAGSGGKEKYGTVIRSGKMKKTVSVRVDNYSYKHYPGLWIGTHTDFLVHDEDNYCKVGDKVVIRKCEKLSKRKYYYIRNVVLPIGRHDYYNKDLSRDEKEAMEHNKRLANSKPRHMKI